MKKMLLMAALMAATLSASAQYDAGTWSLAIRYGLSGGAMTNTPDLSIASALGNQSAIALPAGNLKAGATAGHTFGLEFEKQMADKFSLSFGVDWLTAGMGWESHKWNADNIDYKLDDVSVKMRYVAVPVLANFYIWRGLALHAGVQPAFLTRARMQGRVTYDNNGDYTLSLDRGVKSDFNKFDLAIPVGISYEWSSHIVLDARCNFGLLNVNKEKTIEGKDQQNVSLQFTVGYKFDLSN